MSPKVTAAYKEVTKDKILDAAETLFARKGYYNTSMDDIVAESGLSKGAIYGYFESKDDLFEGLQERVYAPIFEQAKTFASGKDSAGSKLSRLADLYFLQQERLPRDQSRIFLEFLLACLRMKPMQRLEESRYNEVHKMITSLLREGVKRGEFREGIDASSIASILLASLDGFTLREAISDSEVDWKKVRNTLVDLTTRGIAK